MMSINRCVCVFSRLQRHISAQAIRVSGSAHVSAGSCRYVPNQASGSGVCTRGFSNSSSSPKPPDTSLFVPVSLKVDRSTDGGVGAELTQPLDKSKGTSTIKNDCSQMFSGVVFYSAFALRR